MRRYSNDAVNKIKKTKHVERKNREKKNYTKTETKLLAIGKKKKKKDDTIIRKKKE